MANLREEITAELIEQMERGTASWVKPWTAQAIHELPFNANTGNRYQGINSMVLSGAGFEDPRWLTFNQAKAVEARIRKGSRGKRIIFWSDRTEKTILDQNGKPIRNEKGDIQKEAVLLTNPVVRAFTVFNGSQIEGLEPYKAPEIPNTIEQIDEVENLLRSTAVPLFHDQRDRAFYGVSSDEIHMPRPEAFNSQYEYYATALHEMGHASGHESRLLRDMGGAFGSQKYAYEELRAEMASFMSTTQLGLGHYPERHAGYVQNWLSAAKEDKDFLFQAAADAEKISKWVIEPEQRLELEEKAQKKRVPQFLSPTEKAKRLEREKEKEITAQKALKPAELTEAEISKLDLSVVLQDSGREALGARKVTNFWVHEPARSLSHVYIQTRAPLTQNADSLNKVLLDADRILSGDLSDERIKELPHLNLTLPQITYNRKTGMHEVRFEAQTVTEKESLFWTENKSRTDLIEVVFKSHDQKKAQHLAQGFVNATRALEAQKVRVNQPKPMIWLDVTLDNIVEARAKGVLFSPKEQRFYAPDTMEPKLYEKWLPKKEKTMEQEQTQSPSERVYLNVPKEERAEVKKFGGRWDSNRQLWHVPADQLEAAQAAGNWSLADGQEPADKARTQDLIQAFREDRNNPYPDLDVGEYNRAQAATPPFQLKPELVTWQPNEDHDLSVFRLSNNVHMNIVSSSKADGDFLRDLSQALSFQNDGPAPDVPEHFKFETELKYSADGTASITGTLNEKPFEISFASDAPILAKGHATEFRSGLLEYAVPPAIGIGVEFWSHPDDGTQIGESTFEKNWGGKRTSLSVEMTADLPTEKTEHRLKVLEALESIRIEDLISAKRENLPEGTVIQKAPHGEYLQGGFKIDGTEVPFKIHSFHSKNQHLPTAMLEKIAHNFAQEQVQEQAQTQQQAPQERVYLSVPKEERAEVKKFGGRWDQDRQLWHVPADQLEAAQAAGKWSLADEQGQEQKQAQGASQEQEQAPTQEQRFSVPAKESRTYLAVPYDDKDEAKAMGASWDREKKLWFVHKDNEAALARFAPANEQEVKTTRNPQEEFADFLKSYGVAIKGAPVMDGNFHRVSLADDSKGKQNASYRAFTDGIPAGTLKLFKGDQTIKWVATGQTLTPEEKAALDAQAANRKIERQQENKEQQERAGKQAYAIWKNAPNWANAHNSDYLATKQVEGRLGLKVNDKGHTLVPLRDASGFLRNVQTISPEGKRFLKNGKKDGLFHSIGFVDHPNPDKDKIQTIVIAEGVATASTLHNATNLPTVVAFDSGNLKPVAQNIRAEYPNANLVFAADNDHHLLKKEPHKNVGLEKAKEAAQAVGGTVLEPSLSPSEKAQGLTDFNDIQISRGKDKAFATIKAQVNALLSPQKEMDLAPEKARTTERRPPQHEQDQQQGMAL